MNIKELFREVGTGKLSLRYDVAYQFLCFHLREKPNPRIFELGVLDGASIELWRRWFGKDAYIVALDIVPDCAAKAVAADKIYVGNQSDSLLLEKIIAETGGKFDLIVDDASHIPQQQLESFQTLWPHVNDWGVYVVEDCGLNVGKHRARRIKAGEKSVLDVLYEKAQTNMYRFARKPPEEYICFCGMAIFVIRIPKE